MITQTPSRIIIEFDRPSESTSNSSTNPANNIVIGEKALFLAIAKTDLNRHEYKTLCAIASMSRETATARMIADITGIAIKKIYPVRNDLSNRNILKVSADKKQFSINYDLDSWEKRKALTTKVAATNSVNAKAIENKKKTPKTNLLKFVRENYPAIPVGSIKSALEHRKSKKTAQTENAAKLFFDNVISISSELGITPVQVIDVVILRDWKGVKAEWVRSHLNLPYGMEGMA